MAVSAAVDCDPLTPTGPDHPPEAVQAVALVAAQVKLLVPLFATLLGLALKVTVGTGCDTDTVTDCDALLPLDPVQVKV